MEKLQAPLPMRGSSYEYLLFHKIAMLCALTETETDIFPSELIRNEVRRYQTNPQAYQFDDPLFLTPAIQTIIDPADYTASNN